MIKLVKNNWNKINFRDYKEILEISEDSNIDDVEKSIRVISILSETPLEELYNKPYRELESIQGLEFIYSKYEPKNKSVTEVCLDGKKYKIFTTPSDMTVSQYTDLQLYSKNIKEPDLSVYLLSTIIVPKGSKYNDGSYNIEELREKIWEMSVADIIDISFFLIRNCTSLIVDTLESSLLMTQMWIMTMPKEVVKKMKEEQDQMKKTIKTLRDYWGGYR